MITLTFGLACLSFVSCLAPLANLSQNQANASIKGQVYDNRFGVPVSGAKVRVRLEGRVPQDTTTDRGGAYEIKDLAEGPCRISVESLGFALTERTVQVRKGEQMMLDLPLRIGRLHDPISIDISGTARLANNTPLAGVMISVISPFEQEIVAKTTTNHSGQYALKVDEPGQYVVYAVKSGFEVRALSIILRPILPRERFKADFALTPLELK